MKILINYYNKMIIRYKLTNKSWKKVNKNQVSYRKN